LVKKQKPSHWGSVLANEMQGSSDFCRGDPYGVEYTTFELVGVFDSVTHEGGAG